MVTNSDGYSIRQEINNNQIIINLPQTMRTLNNTVESVSYERRLALTETEEASLLMMVKTMLENEVDNGTADN